jgi:hypothetical protein
MVHEPAHPLVFCHSKLKLSNMTTSQVRRYRVVLVFTDLSLLFVYWKMKPPSRGIYCVCLIVTMAPVVQIEPNGSQALLAHDDAINDLQAHGWDIFIRKFEGYNLAVAQDFAQTFDGFRAKVGDLQLEVTEDSIARATRLSQEGEKWFKNAKLEGVPWSLFMVSRNSTCFPKGTPITLLKPRWHDLLLILKQFITCEGRYGLVFLYHIRLLMLFLGFKLNMPFYLLMSLHKMSKRYKKQSLNPLSSLFHHGLIRILLLSHLSQIGDTWENFLCRNNFSLPESTVDSPLHSNVNPNPDNPVTESQGFDSHRDRELTEPIYVAMQNPLGKKPRYNFVPKKSLEEVVDVLKERVSPTPAIEPTQGLIDKPTVKKNRKKKKQDNSDLSFINKRSGRLISRSLRNRKQGSFELDLSDRGQ